MKKTIISSLFIACSMLPVMAVDLKMSVKGPELRVLTEKEAPEGFGRGLPMGPASVRFCGDNIWVVDSIAGAFAEFDKDGKQLRNIAVKDAEKLVIADFALQKTADGSVEALWAVGSEEPLIFKADLAGKVLASFSTELSIPGQIELLPENQLAVLDNGVSAIAIFDAAGKKLDQFEIAGKGFLVKADGTMIYLSAKGEKIFVTSRNLAEKKSVELFELPVVADSHPSILTENEYGDIFYSFVSMDEESDAPAHNVACIDLKGLQKATVTTKFPAAFLARPLINAAGTLKIILFVEEDRKYLLRIDDFTPPLLELESQG